MDHAAIMPLDTEAPPLAPPARKTITLIRREPRSEPLASTGDSEPPMLTEGPVLDPAKVEAALDDIRPSLKRDGGDVELVRIEGRTVYVRLSGSCVGCQMASVTLSGLRERMMLSLRTPIRLIPVN